MTIIRSRLRLGALLLLTVLLVSAVGVRGEPLATTVSHHALARGDVNIYDLYEPDAILIQFAPRTKMRLRDGQPNDESGEVSAAAVDEVRALSAGGTWQRGHTLDEGKLDALWQRAQVNAAMPLPDPNNRFRLQLADGMDAATAVEQYRQLALVEAAYLIPKPVAPPSDLDYAKPGNATGNEVTDPYQGYLDPAPDGIDARWAWLGMGGRGDGMRICDVEYDYNPNHADLPHHHLRRRTQRPALWARPRHCGLG